MVRVVDATGQTLMTYVPASPGKWQTIDVPLVSNFFGTHWGGANDGTLVLPIRSFFVGVQKGRTPSGVSAHWQTYGSRAPAGGYAGLAADDRARSA